MEGKNGSVVLLLALVALCFCTGQSSARRSAIDFASPIQGGLRSAEQSCAVCACAESSQGDRHCFCTDKGPSCRENCKSCVRGRYGAYYCVDSIPFPYDQCKSWSISTAFAEEKMMLESTPTDECI